MVKIRVGRNHHAKVSDKDAKRVRSLPWVLYQHHGIKYARAKNPEGRPLWIRMHRFIDNTPEGVLMDHRNGDGLDNRRSNLRRVSQRENSLNSWKHREGKIKCPATRRLVNGAFVPLAG